MNEGTVANQGYADCLAAKHAIAVSGCKVPFPLSYERKLNGLGFRV